MSSILSLNNLSRKSGEGTEDISDLSVNPTIFNRYKRSFRALRFALEKADIRCPPNVMKKIISYHNSSLKVCLDCFDNTNIKNDGTLQGFASETLQLNIRTTHFLMKSFESEYDNYNQFDNGKYLSKLLEFYYEERLNVIKILCILFYYYGDTNWYYYDSAEDFVRNLDLNEFMDRVFDQFQELADIGIQAFIPENMKDFGFSSQYIKEQIEILELLCLIYKRGQLANKYLIRFLSHCMKTKFGYNQFLTLHIDLNGHAMLTQVNHFTQILIVIMTLTEFNFTQIFPSVHTKNKRVASSTDVRRVTEKALNMDNEPSNGIFLWLWASYLTHIQHFYDETIWPNEYEDLESYFNSMISANAAKAYDLNVLYSIYNIFKGPCFKSEELNVRGYKETFKTYFISIFEAFKIQEIPEHQLLVECFAQVFVDGGPCNEFFKDDSFYEKRISLFTWAISKFPQYFHPLMRLYTSLSGDRDSAEEIFVLLQNFGQCCYLVRDEQLKLVVNNENIVYAKQPIKLFENIYQDAFTIPENTAGHVIEQVNGSKLVQWNIKYSGWHLFLEMLESFPLIEGRRHSDYDPTLPDDPTALRIKEILQLLYVLLSNSPDLIEKLLDHLETCFQDNKPHNDLAFTIFAVIEYVMNNVPEVLDFVTAGLQCIKVLLPYYMSKISSYLLKSGLLPNLASNISNDWIDGNSQFICKLHHLLLQQECVGGHYPITIAVLDFAIELFSHIDDFDLEQDQELRNDSKNILLSFTSYILNVIFVSYDRWRYKNELEHIQVGIKCLMVFNKILLGCPTGPGFPNYCGPMIDITKDSLRNTLQEYLWDHFMMNEGLYHVLPLFYIIKKTTKFSINIERTPDSRLEKSDILLELALAFILRLLKLHKSKTSEISWMELTILDRTNVNFNKGLINIISSYVSYPHSLGVSILSCELMTFLFSSAGRSISSRSSLSGLFGNEFETIAIYNKFIDRFTTEINVKDLRVAILDFFTVSTKVHVGLSIFGGVDLISKQLDRKGKGKETDKKKTIKISVNIIDVITGLLNDWKNAYDSEPRVLLAAVRFLSTLWENVCKGEFIILKKMREDIKLWDNISKILRMKLSDNSVNENEDGFIGLFQGTISKLTVNYDKVCCGRKIKGFLFRLLGRELCLITNHVKNKGNKSRSEFFKSLPAEGIREILKEVLEEDMLEFCLDKFTNIDQQRHEESEESHHLSKIKAQVALFNSWKYFIEIASYILSDGFWITEQKKDISRLLLSMIAERLVKEIHRGYNVKITIRDDLADLLLHLMEQLIISKDQSHGRIILYAELVTLLYNGLTSVINLIQNMNYGHFTSTTHRPILQSLILCLRVLHDSDVILKSKEKVLAQFQKSCQLLLSELCEFLVAMTKKDEADESQEEDILIILTLLEYLVQPLCNPYPSICLGILTEKKIINLLLNMFVYSMSLSWKNRPKFSDGIIYFLLTLANFPIGAMQLFKDGVMASFCNNRLSSELQEGKVEPNLEENWHKIWCLMLAVITAMLRTVERKDLNVILRSVVGFIGLYRKQIQRAMECKLPTDMFRLEEIQYITILFYHLSIHLNSHELDFVNECLIYYDEPLLILLTKLTYLFTHPKYSSRVMMPLTPEEMKQSTTLLSGGIKLAFENVLPDIDLSSSPDSGRSEMNIFLQRVQQKLLSINRNILATYINLTESHNVLHMSIPSWSDQLVYFEPLMKVSDKDPATIATLFELVDHGMTLIQLWEYTLDTNNIKNISDLEFWEITWKSSIVIIEMSFVLATSQLTTYFFSEDRNKEDVEDLFTEIFERLLKVTRVVKKLLDMGVNFKSEKDELKSFEVILRNLQNFLTKTIGIMS